MFSAKAAEPSVLIVPRTDVAQVTPQPFAVPTRAIVLTGDTAIVGKDVYAVFYNTENMAFGDVAIPKFQFISKNGNTVFGIGGAAEVYGYADFRGTVNQYEFDVWKIPTRGESMQSSNIGATASQTSIALKLAQKTKYGVLLMYISSDFAGGDKGDDFLIKQAYVSLNGFTLGYTHSLFSDPAASVPSIDPFGPIGTINKRNMLAAYRHQFNPKLYGSISIEMPKATYSMNPYGIGGTRLPEVNGDQEYSTQSLGQRIPDIPINLQYTWYSGSHIRLAAILRNLPYRDALTGKNHIVTGYGVQVSGMASALGLLDFLYQVSYGQGIGYYVKGLTNEGVDLIYRDTPGKLIMPRTFAFVSGLRFNPNPKFFCSMAFSMARLYDQQFMGPDFFRRGYYLDVNAFWSPVNDLTIGLGYIHGTRYDMDHAKGDANRIEAMVKYSF